MRSSTDVFQDILHTPESSIPLDLLQSAACLAIIPGEKHFAFIVGGKYGKGLVTCRVAHGWSAPAFVMISGGSFGFQIGGSSTDLILVFRNRDGLTRLLSDKFNIGADATAAAGPVGRQAGASTDLELHAEILTYSRSRGVFAGISLAGAVFEPDREGNVAMYGPGAAPRNILNGEVAAPKEAAALLKDISEYAEARGPFRRPPQTARERPRSRPRCKEPSRPGANLAPGARACRGSPRPALGKSLTHRVSCCFDPSGGTGPPECSPRF